MRLEEPGWWYADAHDVRSRKIARVLAPLGRLYGRIAQSRFNRSRPYRSRLPVICVGNFTAGGTGKTPLALFIAQALKAQGGNPVFLTRGYGGSESGPMWVTEEPGSARRFGDEPLLLSRVAPTLVARDRAAGVRMIEESGRPCTAVIMDDGLQNAAIVKDLSLAVVDAARGLGNGEVIPAGPLRAPIDFQLGLVDAIVVREADGAPANPAEGMHALLRRVFPGPVLEAHIEPAGDTAWLAGASVVAFAGIANPQRFFSLVEGLGANLLQRAAFPDHHDFSRADAYRLLSYAREHKALLVTTEKDLARISGAESIARSILEQAKPLAIAMVLAPRDLGRLQSLIEAAVQAKEARRNGAPPQP